MTPTPLEEVSTPLPFQTPEGQACLAAMMNDAGIDRVQALNADLRIITWNKMCEDLTGLRRAEVLGRGWFDVFPQAHDWPAITEAVEQALKGRRSFVPAEEGAFEKGHFERHFLPLRPGENAPVEGLLIIVHDVSHRVAAENKLKELNRELRGKVRELERAAAELATFTHVTSHDLKEPLRKIYTFVELTITEEAQRLSDKGRGNLRRVQQSVQRLGLLTDDLVVFAEASAGDEPVEIIEGTEVLNKAKAALSPLMRERGAVIEAEPLPRLALPPRQAVLLFRHLLSNAIKFHPEEATPQVNISSVPVLGADTGHKDALPEVLYSRVQFSDRGIGIEAQYFEKIFGVFQRLHDKKKYAGSGIGLAICKKIAERHGGFITVESTPGEGSIFRCFLPEVSTH